MLPHTQAHTEEMNYRLHEPLDLLFLMPSLYFDKQIFFLFHFSIAAILYSTLEVHQPNIGIFQMFKAQVHKKIMI